MQSCRSTPPSPPNSSLPRSERAAHRHRTPPSSTPSSHPSQQHTVVAPPSSTPPSPASTQQSAITASLNIGNKLARRGVTSNHCSFPPFFPDRLLLIDPSSLITGIFLNLL
ncbi:unnamed protein product [Cuscuta europaea]|uniref:Uncharacterized protein n=1 Tax=Cuscuta europaea TaxID=41803 RepID=A0A9P0YZQ6_CUSEU|nr:unnamed protein product [Cuscuta europaea]